MISSSCKTNVKLTGEGAAGTIGCGCCTTGDGGGGKGCIKKILSE